MQKKHSSRSYKKKSGHRSWAAKNGPVPGEHRGDIMSPEKRSEVMARIKSKNTNPERVIFALIKRKGISFGKHANDLPGKPDIIFRHKKVAVFLDGNFWHGWRFPLWEHKLSEKWREKINATRNRDQRNFRKLRDLDWKVVRIWEHQIEKSPEECLERILMAIK